MPIIRLAFALRFALVIFGLVGLLEIIVLYHVGTRTRLSNLSTSVFCSRLLLTVKFGSLSEFRSWDANVSKRKNGLKRCHDNSAASGARASHDREIGGVVVVAAASAWRRTSFLQI